MMTNRMLSGVCARLGEGVGSARALVDGDWVQMTRLNDELDAEGRIALNFGLRTAGAVTRVQLYGVDGALWDDREEDFQSTASLEAGTLYRLTYALTAGPQSPQSE